MKKLLALVLALVMVLSFTACGSKDDSGKADEGKKLKIGAILLGDENEGYTYAHIKGIQEAAKALNLDDDQIIWKYSVKEDAGCKDTALDLVDAGCDLIVSNSYGHNSFIQEAAKECPDTTFVAMTGDTAANSGLTNFKNAFTSIYESRYVSGVVAGMKLKELLDAGKVAEAKVGYVGAYPFAEVKSGYTAFFLGIQSIVPEATMEVIFTNSWFDITKEGEAANTLMADGCVIIGQHADSTGAPAAVEAAQKNGKVVYSIGYNISMLNVAPNAALTSATNNWNVYYEYAFKCMLDGTTIDTDWAKGYNEGAVATTELGTACAEGTAEKVKEVSDKIKAGELHVFDTSKFTVAGKAVDSCVVDLTGNFANTDPGDKEAVWDGYFHESELRSAPSFVLDIDGITIK